MTVLKLAQLDAHPRNPREHIGDIEGLASTVKEFGVLEPVVVTPNGDRFTILSGHRRVAAAASVGLEDVPVHVVEHIGYRDSQRAALIANLHRQDLTPLEEAGAIKELLRDGVSQRTLAARLGVSQSHISKRLALLNPPAFRSGLLESRSFRETPRPQVDASRVLRRLSSRAPDEGLYLSPGECEAVVALIKHAAETLRRTATSGRLENALPVLADGSAKPKTREEPEAA